MENTENLKKSKEQARAEALRANLKRRKDQQRKANDPENRT